MQVYDPELGRVISAAFTTFHGNLDQAGAFLARQVHDWLEAMRGEIPPEEVYKHPLSYPMLLFPWWVEKALRQAPDFAWQTDLVYSTVNGYYAIRMIDNLMDGHATIELQILPALNFFYTEFQRPYQRYFAHEHPFWDHFTATWYASAEVTIRDARAETIDRDHFVQVTARKTCAVKIPVAAVCYRYERPDLIPPWAQLVDLFGCWHQMYNDLFDWRQDLERETHTYFLSEAERRKKPAESVTDWVIREGFAWGIETLAAWMAQLQAMSDELGSPDALAYLKTREAMLSERQKIVVAGLQSAAQLLTLLRQAAVSSSNGHT
ncbi:MAG: hypothetical protein AMJ93_06925 [Anaerolineae bacterium SM23_84]|nr:MAG: hypothetical protein AMJ93_06925 [Anaerolineae bacterium SM23_84]